MPNEVLRSFIQNPNEAKQYLNYLNHTQPVERAIQDLTKVAQRHPIEDRDAVLRIKVASRIKMPRYDRKGLYGVFEAGVPEGEQNELDNIESEDEEHATIDDDRRTYEDADGFISDDSD